MADRRKVEIFSAGCAACEEAERMVRELACQSCDVEVLDMHDAEVAARAAALAVHVVPAVAIDGALAACCAGQGPDRETLTEQGIGQPLP